MRIERLISTLVATLALSMAPASGGRAETDLPAVTARGRVLAEYETTIRDADSVLRTQSLSVEGAPIRFAKKAAGGWVVVFGRLDRLSDAFLTLYEAVAGPEPHGYTIRTYDPPLREAGFDLRTAKAIQVAFADFRQELAGYQAVLIPTESDEFYVYVMPTQNIPGVYRFGGDARYLISADGSKIIERLQMHRAILEFSEQAPQQRQMAAGFHSDVLSDVPDDTDVAYVLIRKPSLPEFVRTRNHVYEIQVDGTILVKQ